MKLIPIGLGLAALGLIYASTRPVPPKAGGAPQPLPGPGPLPGPAQPAPNVDLLRQEVGALLAQATIAPGTVDPRALDALATELENAGLTAEAAQVRARSTELKKAGPVL